MPGRPNGSGHDVVVVGASAGGIEALKHFSRRAARTTLQEALDELTCDNGDETA
jgi:chemotaxis response regulator CheB